jgi:hypothetical protein
VKQSNHYEKMMLDFVTGNYIEAHSREVTQFPGIVDGSSPSSALQYDYIEALSHW